MPPLRALAVKMVQGIFSGCCAGSGRRMHALQRPVLCCALVWPPDSCIHPLTSSSSPPALRCLPACLPAAFAFAFSCCDTTPPLSRPPGFAGGGGAVDASERAQQQRASQASHWSRYPRPVAILCGVLDDSGYGVFTPSETKGAMAVELSFVSITALSLAAIVVRNFYLNPS